MRKEDPNASKAIENRGLVLIPAESPINKTNDCPISSESERKNKKKGRAHPSEKMPPTPKASKARVDSAILLRCGISMGNVGPTNMANGPNRSGACQ